MPALRARLRPEPVEVDIRGNLERVAHVDRPIDGAPRVLEDDSADGERAAVVDDLIGRDQPLLEGGGRDDRLEGGARRVAALVGSIQQRGIAPILQGSVLGLGARLHVEGGVEGGVGAHRQHGPRAGVHRHEGARPPRRAQRRLAGRLQRRVEGEAEVGPGAGRPVAELTLRPAEGVDLDPELARRAAQVAVVGVLHPRLADHLTGLEAVVSRPLQLSRAHLADDPEHVRRQRAGSVAADEGALDAEAGEAAPVLEQVEEQRAAQPLLEHDRLPRELRGMAELGSHLSRGEPQQISEFGELPPAIGPSSRELGGPEHKGHHGAVVDQDPSLPIEDLAALGLDADLANPVAVGEGAVTLPRDHLQRPDPQQESRDDRDHEPGEDGDSHRQARTEARREILRSVQQVQGSTGRDQDHPWVSSPQTSVNSASAPSPSSSRHA